METRETDLRRYYSDLYKTKSEDSPEKSRVWLARKIVDKCRENMLIKWILDLGCGAGILQRHLQTYKYWREEISGSVDLFTADQAWVNWRKLRANGRHCQMRGEELGFPSESFDMVVSGMALDFMPENAWNETVRVLKPGGWLVLTLHHPDMLKGEPKTWNKNEQVTEFWIRLKEEQRLFESGEAIRARMEGLGMTIEEIESCSAGDGSWWQVVARKSGEMLR